MARTHYYSTRGHVFCKKFLRLRQPTPLLQQARIVAHCIQRLRVVITIGLPGNFERLEKSRLRLFQTTHSVEGHATRINQEVSPTLNGSVTSAASIPSSVETIVAEFLSWLTLPWLFGDEEPGSMLT